MSLKSPLPPKDFEPQNKTLSSYLTEELHYRTKKRYEEKQLSAEAQAFLAINDKTAEQIGYPDAKNDRVLLAMTHGDIISGTRDELEAKLDLAQANAKKQKRRFLITTVILSVVIVALAVFVYINGSMLYKEGVNNGFYLGREQGYADGNESGYAEGYEIGFQDGEEQGYDAGIIKNRAAQFVYITPTGDKYHTMRCQYVNTDNRTIKLTLDQAVDAGYTPCSECRPPKQ